MDRRRFYERRSCWRRRRDGLSNSGPVNLFLERAIAVIECYASDRLKQTEVLAWHRVTKSNEYPTWFIAQISCGAWGDHCDDLIVDHRTATCTVCVAKHQIDHRSL